MDEAAAPETCCAMMPEARLRKGWISSARPAGEKILQWCFWMRGARRGSVLMRWVRPRSRRWVVVVVVGGYATRRVPLGVLRGALVMCGSAGREGGVLGRASSVLGRPERRVTWEGVGVAGGGLGRLGLERLGLGVEGGSIVPGLMVPLVASLIGSFVDLLLRGLVGGSAGGFVGASLVVAADRMALLVVRVELMVEYRIRVVCRRLARLNSMQYVL